jgi:hypothetical protein
MPGAAWRRIGDNGAMSDRLTSRLAARSDYIVLVGVPLEAPVRWVRASSYTADEIITPEGRFPAARVRRFVVAYPNQQVLDAVPGRLGIPKELTRLIGDHAAPPTQIALADVTAGRRLVDVRYSRARHTLAFATTIARRSSTSGRSGCASLRSARLATWAAATA